MLHYRVWFNLRSGISEEHGLGVMRRYLESLRGAGDVMGFQLLRNAGGPPRSKLPAYHALVEFADSTALSTAMTHQVQRGIHSGGHGEVVDVVCDFHVEVFVTAPASEPVDALHACEI